MYGFTAEALSPDHKYRVYTFLTEQEKRDLEQFCNVNEVSVAFVLNYALRCFLYGGRSDD